jgi:peptide deformylase
LNRRPVTFVLGKKVKSYPDFAYETQRGTARRVTEIGEPVLHTPAAAITEFGTPELATLVDDMFASMDVAQGVGLAAPQIGVGLQVFVYDLVDENEDRHVGAVINPTLTMDMVVEPITQDEGCLSVPGAFEPLSRPGAATIEGFDLHGSPIKLTAEGYLARCFIHEAQHLQGTLYWDHLSPELQADALRQRDENRATVITERAEAAADLDKVAPDYPEAPAGGK